jgi:hypothetical protein
MKGVFVCVLNDNNEIIQPVSIKLNNPNCLTISFDNEKTGKVLLKSFGNVESIDSLKQRLENGIYKIGTGTTGLLYDPTITNDIEESFMETTSTLTEYVSGGIDSHAYFDNNEEAFITEFAIIDSYTNEILCYSYFDKLYKYYKTNISINTNFRSL